MDGRSLLLMNLTNMTLFLYLLTLASCFLLLKVVPLSLRLATAIAKYSAINQLAYLSMVVRILYEKPPLSVDVLFHTLFLGKVEEALKVVKYKPGAARIECTSATMLLCWQFGIDMDDMDNSLFRVGTECTITAWGKYYIANITPCEGAIIYAYVVCCLDIGYAATFLSCFSQAPAREHYKALKDIVKYLWHTVDWGIIYWWQNPVNSLPRINLPDIPIDPSLPMFPTHDLLQLTGYVDAAHATDLKTHCSISGYVFTWPVVPSHSS
jgi:hypothetical protein